MATLTLGFLYPHSTYCLWMWRHVLDGTHSCVSVFHSSVSFLTPHTLVISKVLHPETTCSYGIVERRRRYITRNVSKKSADIGAITNTNYITSFPPGNITTYVINCPRTAWGLVSRHHIIRRYFTQLVCNNSSKPVLITAIPGHRITHGDACEHCYDTE